VVDRYRAAELVSAVRAGDSGYFVEGITRDVCIKSLEWMLIGEADLPTTFQSDVLGHEEHRLDDHEPILATDQIVPQLTRREKLILRCLVEGDSNKSIAKKIDSSLNTVKVHVKAILRKIRVHSRTQAAIWGMRNAPYLRTSVDTAPPLSGKVYPDVDTHRSDDHEPILATDQIVPQLTPREKLILGCLVEGDSNKSIANKIDSRETAVKVHVKAILRKLRVHSRAQAAIWGMKNAYRVKPPFERCRSVRKAPEN